MHSCFFFFSSRRRHTRLVSDWSSDVCSSDLDAVALHRVWGFSDFRPLQRDAMHAVLDGRDSVVILPTGGGKSLCFQAPAIVDAGSQRTRPTRAADAESKRIGPTQEEAAGRDEGGRVLLGP